MNFIQLMSSKEVLFSNKESYMLDVLMLYVQCYFIMGLNFGVLISIL